MTNRDNFLKWLQETIVSFSSGPPPVAGSPEGNAHHWLGSYFTVPPLDVSHDTDSWIADRMALPMLVPAVAQGWLLPLRKGEMYYLAVETIIDELLETGGEWLKENDPLAWEAYNWFRAKPKPPENDGQEGDMGMPDNVRKWVRRRLPPPIVSSEMETKTCVSTCGAAEGKCQVIADGKTMTLRAGTLDYDMTQALVARDCARRIGGPVGRQLMRDVSKAVLKIAHGMQPLALADQEFAGELGGRPTAPTTV